MIDWKNKKEYKKKEKETTERAAFTSERINRWIYRSEGHIPEEKEKQTTFKCTEQITNNIIQCVRRNSVLSVVDMKISALKWLNIAA